MRHVVVHSLEEARTALSKGGPVCLESPPGAAGFHGIGWWQALLRILADEGRAFDSVLDCADAPGLALAAIAAGIPCVRLDAPGEAFEKVQAIGLAAGVRVIGPQMSG